MRRSPWQALFLLVACAATGGPAVAEAAPQQGGAAAHGSTLRPSAEAAPAAVDEVAARIVEKTNAFRRRQDLQVLETDPALERAAEDFAAFMARTDEYGHKADGRAPADRAKAHGYDFCSLAENIGYQFSTAGFSTPELAKAFVRGWRQSPAHRDNMLAPSMTEIGVGAARSDESGRYYAVQMFGRPRSMRVELKISNDSDTAVHYELAGRDFLLRPRYTRTHWHCSPGGLTIRWQGERAPTTLQPNDGDHVRIEAGEAGNLRVRGG